MEKPPFLEWYTYYMHMSDLRESGLWHGLRNENGVRSYRLWVKDYSGSNRINYELVCEPYKDSFQIRWYDHYFDSSDYGFIPRNASSMDEIYSYNDYEANRLRSVMSAMGFDDSQIPAFCEYLSIFL